MHAADCAYAGRADDLVDVRFDRIRACTRLFTGQTVDQGTAHGQAPIAAGGTRHINRVTSARPQPAIGSGNTDEGVEERA